MCLLISTIPEAQAAITAKLLEVSRTHSVQSVSSLTEKLDYLRSYGDGKFDVVIVSAHHDHHSGQVEFSLNWIFKNDQAEHTHPIYQKSWMIGGLVYHPHTDEWGVHT